VDWQKVACAIAARSRFSIITGGPGTGKTYTAARLLALLFAIDPAPERLRVALAAPTGKAAARLKQSIDSALTQLQPQLDDVPALRGLASRIAPARTLHSLLGARPDTRRFKHDATNPVDIDVLIVDEASMVHLEMMASLLDALPAHTRVVLLGDKDQLASVEAGSVLADLCSAADAAAYDSGTRSYLAEVTGEALPGSPARGSPLAQQTVMLRESRRFDGPIGALAHAVNSGDAVQAASLLRAGTKEGLTWLGDGSPNPSAALRSAIRLAVSGRGYRTYSERLRERPAVDESSHALWVGEVLRAFDAFRILCATREGDAGVEGMNAAVERALVHEGLLSRTDEWYEGRPVIVTRNDPAVGVFNGDVGIALRAPGRSGALRVYFSDGVGSRSILSSRLGNVETAYAMTVHKSQGSEFEHVLLSLPKANRQLIARELLYTGITRARKAFTLLTDGPDSLQMALSHRTARGSGLAEMIRAEVFN
jgi:exodeoxyribonuclease V alpha subunit